ncbi:hypothetical protein ACIRFH_23070 [Streptomyces sp. NPDC093586]
MNGAVPPGRPGSRRRHSTAHAHSENQQHSTTDQHSEEHRP